MAATSHHFRREHDDSDLDPRVIRCRAQSCPINERGRCAISAPITIDPSGRCETCVRMQQQPPSKLERHFCRVCGLELIATDYGTWAHRGVTLRHPGVP